MKIVINEWANDGFVLPPKFVEENYPNGEIPTLISRLDDKLVEFVEKYEYTDGCDLTVVEIPDDVSDWCFDIAKDGSEQIIYVTNGFIHFA